MDTFQLKAPGMDQTAAALGKRTGPTPGPAILNRPQGGLNTKDKK